MKAAISQGSFSVISKNTISFTALIMCLQMLFFTQVSETRAQMNWTWQYPKPTGFHLYDAAWTGSLLVVVGDSGSIFTSPDGTVWSPRESGTGNPLYHITRGDSLLVAVGGNGVIVTSPDGISWTVRNSGTNDMLFSVNWNGARYLAVGSFRTVISSTDGITWTDNQTGYTSGRFIAVAWGDSQYVATAYDGNALLCTSPDGKT